MPTEAPLRAQRPDDSPSTGALQQATDHLPALDGLRGLAVAWVMLHHFNHGATHHNELVNVAFVTFKLGYFGVDLFFVLSGFLITRILLETRDAPNYFRAFYGRRMLRIFPLYYLALFIALVVWPLLQPFTPEQQRLAEHQWWLWAYLSNIGMAVHNEPLFDAGSLKLLHFWSLAIEEQFYLLWPAVVLMLSRRQLIAACGVLIGVAVVARGVVPLYVDQPMASFVTLSKLDGLSAGAFLAALEAGPGGLRRLGRTARTLAPVAIAALIVLVIVREGRGAVNVAAQHLTPLALIAAVAAILTLAANGERPADEPHAPRGLTARVLGAAPLVFLGKYSYALYVFHYMLMPVFDRYLHDRQIEAWTGSWLLAMAVRMAACFAISIGVALLSWHLFEKHFLGFKRYFRYLPPAPTGQTVPQPVLVDADEDDEAVGPARPA
jgi:peptidoglycan/LPS O-acetylase OafA/YrhL